MHRADGQAFLSLIILIGGTVVLIGVTLAFFASSYVDTGYGYQALTQADLVANSGIQDGLLQLERNTSFSNPGGYSLPVGSSTATVKVTQNSPSAGLVTIWASATISNRTRNMSAVVSVNATTSQVNVISWQAIQ